MPFSKRLINVASISSTPLTMDGSKSLPFLFAKRQAGSKQDALDSSSDEIGTIQLILHQCDLEEVAISSERRPIPINLPPLKGGHASHCTKLDAVKFEPSRRAYRCKRKDADGVCSYFFETLLNATAWVTFRWAYGSTSEYWNTTCSFGDHTLHQTLFRTTCWLACLSQKLCQIQ